MQTANERRAKAREYMRQRRAAGRCMGCPGKASNGPFCTPCRIRRKKQQGKPGPLVCRVPTPEEQAAMARDFPQYVRPVSFD